MIELIKYELKKIFSQKIVWAIVALIFLFTITNYMNINKKNIVLNQEITQKYEGILDDEKVQTMLNDFKPTEVELEKYQVDIQYIQLNSMQSAIHTRFADAKGNWNGKTVQDVFGNENIQVGYNDGWFDLSHFITKIMVMIIVFAIIIISTIYSKEYNGMDNIILSTKYGKSKCSTAKNIASVMSVLVVTIFFIILNWIITFGIYGNIGLDSSVLFTGISNMDFITANITCRQMLIYQAILSVSGIMLLSGILLVISSKSKNQIVSLIVSTLIMFFPLFLNISENNKLFKLLGVMPIYQIQFASILSLNNMKYYFTVIVVSIIMLLFGWVFSKRAFSKHQVS